MSDVSEILLNTTEELPSHNTTTYFLEMTPSRILKEISSIPRKLLYVDKRVKQVGIILPPKKHITTRKCAEISKINKELKRVNCRCTSAFFPNYPLYYNKAV